MTTSGVQMRLPMKATETCMPNIYIIIIIIKIQKMAHLSLLVIKLPRGSEYLGSKTNTIVFLLMRILAESIP